MVPEPDKPPAKEGETVVEVSIEHDDQYVAYTESLEADLQVALELLDECLDSFESQIKRAMAKRPVSGTALTDLKNITVDVQMFLDQWEDDKGSPATKEESYG
jgi:hypothetical protein